MSTITCFGIRFQIMGQFGSEGGGRWSAEYPSMHEELEEELMRNLVNEIVVSPLRKGKEHAEQYAKGGR